MFGGTGIQYFTHQQSCTARIHTELVLDEFRQEGGESCYQESFTRPSEVEEEESRVGDEVA
jgi:hypothetical protein